MDKGQTFSNGHNLDKLWNEAKQYLDQAIPEGKFCWDEMNRQIKKLSNFNGSNEPFRYPYSSKKKPLNQELSSIDLQALFNEAEEVIKSLEAIDLGLDIALEHKEEMESYFSW